MDVNVIFHSSFDSVSFVLSLSNGSSYDVLCCVIHMKFPKLIELCFISQQKIVRFHRAHVLDSSTPTPVRAESRLNQRNLEEPNVVIEILAAFSSAAIPKNSLFKLIASLIISSDIPWLITCNLNAPTHVIHHQTAAAISMSTTINHQNHKHDARNHSDNQFRLIIQIIGPLNNKEILGALKSMAKSAGPGALGLKSPKPPGGQHVVGSLEPATTRIKKLMVQAHELTLTAELTCLGGNCGSIKIMKIIMGLDMSQPKLYERICKRVDYKEDIEEQKRKKMAAKATLRVTARPKSLGLRLGSTPNQNR
ncbi:hypothetical protein LguiB_032075 [Lonicera macranthoides]